MELTIQISRKGTRVVKATELHRALGLKDDHYQTNIRYWRKDVYQFSDGIRRPLVMKDYASDPKSRSPVMKEYWLCVEFSKLIALSSKSKVKQAVATKLCREEEAFPENVQLTTADTLNLLEQVKVMARFSCQKAAESRHLAYYSRKRESTDYWNHFRRERIVDRTMADLKDQLRMRGTKIAAKAELRDLIKLVDPYELIRIGIIDHYAALGNSLPYCQQLGHLAKELARQLRLEIVDDRKGDLLFAPMADVEVLRKMQRVAA
jgi:phage anti-repressor protein